MPPTSIDGTDITGATIDGQDVQEITVDGQTVFTAGPQVPTSGLLHQWDWSAPSSTTSLIEDLEGSADLTGTFNGFGTINGKQAGTFDTTDIFESSGITSFSSNRLIATVFQSDPAAATGTGQVIWDDDTTANVLFELSGDYSFFGGGVIGGGTPNSSPHIAVVEFDSTDKLRIDGTQIASGNAGSNTMDVLRVGLQRNGTQPLLGEIGEILMYDLSSANVSDIETYLSDKWGITI